MKDLKLNDPVAVVINGAINFGVIFEVHDKTNRHGTRRLVAVEFPQVDPKHLKEDDIPEYDRALVERDDLIRKIDTTWQWTAPQDLADMIRESFQYKAALARSAELNAPVPQVDTAAAPTPPV